MTDKQSVVTVERIEAQIFMIRGQKVMLSTHLAELYEVEVRALVQAVKRNIERFPEDFMFQLNAEEFANLKSQIVISSWGGSRAAPYAFTEQGVAMLSSVLRSDARHPRQRGNHARLRPAAADARFECRPRPQACDARKEIRRAIQDRVRRHPRTHDPARSKEEAAHRVCAVEGEIKMQRPVAPAWTCLRADRQLRQQRTDAVKLDAAIAANLKELGYGG